METGLESRASLQHYDPAGYRTRVIRVRLRYTAPQLWPKRICKLHFRFQLHLHLR